MKFPGWVNSKVHGLITIRKRVLSQVGKDVLQIWFSNWFTFGIVRVVVLSKDSSSLRGFFSLGMGIAISGDDTWMIMHELLAYIIFMHLIQGAPNLIIVALKLLPPHKQLLSFINWVVIMHLPIRRNLSIEVNLYRVTWEFRWAYSKELEKQEQCSDILQWLDSHLVVGIDHLHSKLSHPTNILTS